MEITINLDLPAIVAQAVSAERIQPIVDKAIGEAVKSAITDATSYNSVFRNRLKEQIAAAMPHGLGVEDLAKFQHILNASMNTLVRECNTNSVHTALEQAVKDVMPDVPPVVKMSELLNLARDGFLKDAHEAFYAFYKPSEHGGGLLYLDSNERPGSSRYDGRDGRKYSAAIRLAFNQEGDVYALKFDGADVTPASRPTVISAFQSTLMAMYVGRTKIEVDMDDDDVEGAAQAQYD